MKIETELTNEEVKLALAGDVNLLWNTFKTLEGDEEFKVKYGRVKYGVEVIFDIRSIIEGLYEIKPAFNKVVIERKQEIDITDYRDEMDKRESIMKECIRELYDDTFDNQKEENIKGYDD